jgi:hypothetical protein
LLQALPGEFTCNWLVSAIKVHPHTHSFQELDSGNFNSDNGKCKKGNVKKFEKAILLIRNPYDSIWSEFQRRLTQSHVGGVEKKNFDWHRWQANAASLSHNYFEMWTVHHFGIEKKFKKKNILYVKYEDLKNKKTRIDTLKNIVEFLNLTHVANGLRFKKQQQQKIDNKLEKQKKEKEILECAFKLAENKHAHRVVVNNNNFKNNFKNFNDNHLIHNHNNNKNNNENNAEEEAIFMTKYEAYTRPLVCRMWNKFGLYASKHGYEIYNNFTCVPAEDFPAIQNVNVGPQGEYNNKWIKPGAKLIDFGGWNKKNSLNSNNNNNNNVNKLNINDINKLNNVNINNRKDVKEEKNKENKKPENDNNINKNNNFLKNTDNGLIKKKKKIAQNFFLANKNNIEKSSNNNINNNINNNNINNKNKNGVMTIERASFLTNTGKKNIGVEKPAWQ